MARDAKLPSKARQPQTLWVDLQVSGLSYVQEDEEVVGNFIRPLGQAVFSSLVASARKWDKLLAKEWKQLAH